MLTPKEYLDAGWPTSNEFWLDGTDIIKHCLQKDTTQTFYKDPAPSPYFDRWLKAMENRAQNSDNFTDIYDNAYQPKEQWQTIDNDSGLLDVGQFINGDELCFEDDIQCYQEGQCVSILIDIAVSAAERNATFMIARHQKIYDLIAQCDGENRPVQVVGVFSIRIPEQKIPLNLFIVVKEYNGAIFPAIWGTLINNQSCNNFINVVMDYFIGTTHIGNGRLVTLTRAEECFPELEDLHIFGTRIQSQYNQNKGA